MPLHSRIIAGLETASNLGLTVRRAICRRFGHIKLPNTIYVIDGRNLDYCARCGEPYVGPAA